MNLEQNSEQIKIEIAAKLGFIPPFFEPAEQTPQVLENLWQQTLSAYINNPLPALFKEKLSAYLSRFCAVPYCMICHSCTLRPLGLRAREVLELLEAPPPAETDVDEHIRLLAAQPDLLNAWPESNSKLEESLLYCAIFIALQNQTEAFQNELRRILGATNYQHLVTFIAYVKTCHIWMEAHPEIAYEADKRVQDHLAALLEEEPTLADFFRDYQTRVKRECQSRAEQLIELAERRRNEQILRQQTERERLLAQMAQRIRASLNLEEILGTTVSEVRQFLQSERVFIYRFEPDWGGFVAVESVEPGWSPILGTKIKDSFFGAAAGRELYHQGRIQATADIHTAGLSKCHLDLLTRLQIRGNLVVPIVQGEQLWGLLVANQCSAPRQWQQQEIDLLKQLATQVAIAIQQSELYQQVQTELSDRQRLEAQFLRTQRLESIGTLASGIAHDLNNVLGPVLMVAELLRERIIDQQSQVLLQELEVSAKRGANLVKQVLSFARGMEGKRTIVQIRHLLLEIQQIAKQTFPKTIKICTDVSSDLWTVSGDATQLDQVLMNLVVNARDAMSDGGTLRISAENLFVDENSSRMYLDAQVGPYVVITVTDTGMGIPPEIMERIFEPFFTTKEVGKGTGLGLSTVLGIIKSHGGFINVSSQVRKGSEFKVFLPAVSATETRQLEDIELPRGNGELILIVDDEAAIRETTKALLETQNYKVLVASNGIEAIASYAQHKNKIAAVLLDMMMPDMDGPTATCVLQKINSSVSIIAVSGLMLSDKMNAAMGTGIKRFLSKPYTAQELLRTLKDVCILPSSFVEVQT